jgi:uncharacterized protein involved in cysteine biosynthesis
MHCFNHYIVAVSFFNNLTMLHRWEFRNRKEKRIYCRIENYSFNEYLFRIIAKIQ